MRFAGQVERFGRLLVGVAAIAVVLAAPAVARAFTLEYSISAQRLGSAPGQFVAPALDLPLRIVASTLFGGAGDDVLNGGAGRDDMRGGLGADGLIARDGVGDRRVDGGPACDEGVLDRGDRRISVEFSNLDGSTALCPRSSGPQPPPRRRG